MARSRIIREVQETAGGLHAAGVVSDTTMRDFDTVCLPPVHARTRPPTHPGGILKRQYLEPLHLSIAQAALALGVSRKTLSKIVNERGSVTPEMALRLGQALHTTPELWLNLQRAYDLWYAAHASEDWRQVHELVAAV